MCAYFWIEFIGFMLERKNLLDYTNLFCSDDYRKMIK